LGSIRIMWVKEAIWSSNWSSTASSGIASYLGNGSEAERTVMKMARVARNR